VKTGLVRVYVTKLEQREYDPTLTMLVRLAKALRVSVTELLGEGVSASQWWQVGEGSLCDARGGRGSCPHSERDVYRPVSEQAGRPRAPSPPCSRDELVPFANELTLAETLLDLAPCNRTVQWGGDVFRNHLCPACTVPRRGVGCAHWLFRFQCS
jgi:hypothetical protein